MARRKDNPPKAAMREMMRDYLKNNDISIKDGTDVNSIRLIPVFVYILKIPYHISLHRTQQFNCHLIFVKYPTKSHFTIHTVHRGNNIPEISIWSAVSVWSSPPVIPNTESS